ncbi:hypothetical protein [Bdellovibrio sp. HCB2-146]|uniref:hypothetical protein n=1 Tax=Bdellovibrio sp. HCB2-146 TaxID=3394362 RepID=UPI0039BC4BA9
MMKLRNLLLSALAITAVATTSCINRDEDTSENEKPTTAADLATVLDEAWVYSDAKSSPLEMKVGEFALFHTTQQLETQQPRLYMQEGINLMKIEVKPDTEEPEYLKHTYTFAYETAIYTGDNAQQSTKEQGRAYYTKNPQAATPAVLNLLGPKGLHLMADDIKMELGYEKLLGLAMYSCTNSEELVKACQEQLGAETCSRACTNLETSDEVVNAPESMRSQPNCGGLSDCKIHQKRIKFNSTLTVKYKNMTETQKVNYSFAVSPDLPYLARMPEFCVRALASYNSGKFLVTNCVKLANYRPAP